MTFEQREMALQILKVIHEDQARREFNLTVTFILIIAAVTGAMILMNFCKGKK